MIRDIINQVVTSSINDALKKALSPELIQSLVRDALKQIIADEFSDGNVTSSSRFTNGSGVRFEEVNPQSNSPTIKAATKMDHPLTRGQRGARTRATNRAAKEATAEKTRRPPLAVKHAVYVGQQYKGKSYSRSLKNRVIEISSLGRTQIIPKILSTSAKRITAKPISYEHLRTSYDVVASNT